MPGQRPTYYLEAQTPPTFILNFAMEIPSPGGALQNIPLFTCPFDSMVIEEIVLRYNTNAGTARTATIVKADDTVDPDSANTAITTSVNLNSTTFTNITAAFRSAVGATSAADGSNPPSENIVTRGQTVYLRGNAAIEAALTGLIITMRCCGFRS